MKITRRSQLSGIKNTLDIPITEEQLEEYARGAKLIQNIVSDLSANEQEFLITGITSKELDDAFKNLKPDC